MNQPPDNYQLPTHLKNLSRWIVLVPIVLLVLFACGQLALVSATSPAVQGPLTKMQANYHLWDFIEFQPVQSAIFAEIQKDRSRYPYGAPPSMVLLPGEVWPTQQALSTSNPNTPMPTEQNTPTLPATPISQPSATMAITPSATRPLVIFIPATSTDPPPPPNTPTATASATATATATSTATSTSTSTPTKTPTSPGLNLGPPDSSYSSIPNGSEIIIDLEAETGSPLDTSSPDGNYDLVFYERINFGSQIAFDHVILQVGTGPSGSCGSSAWYTVLYWGDSDPANNGHIGNMFGGVELDNQAIFTSDLYNNTGIAIDADALGLSAVYPCLKIISPISGDGDAAEVDAIEILP
ncbi:MAG: hypothetical protein K8R77_09420 [Anaerolineaceae bacterium]|nr:hypothetical protein [Anaerolineaceae bacterium]